MIPLNELLAFIEDAVSRYPEAVEWFERDADLEAWVKGDRSVTPTRIVYTTLRIPPGIVELYPAQELWDGCQDIADRHGLRAKQ